MSEAMRQITSVKMSDKLCSVYSLNDGNMH